LCKGGKVLPGDSDERENIACFRQDKLLCNKSLKMAEGLSLTEAFLTLIIILICSAGPLRGFSRKIY
jgi:hypothetical protein